MDALGKLGSRKLTGLVVTLLVLLLVFSVYLVASLFVNVSEVVVTAISTAVTSLGLGHQGAQTMADRSPYYQTPTQFLSQPEQPYAGPPPGQGARV